MGRGVQERKKLHIQHAETPERGKLKGFRNCMKRDSLGKEEGDAFCFSPFYKI